ncbi:hypothetical protein A3B84_00950 [Candidatus Nomurabacteria bacterium RIFCSPHIGHO2_02_FULL_35_13]|nr:MAG: hypothetical protein A3B84_00950 [Candidatus Nomurabacteria bacterium RIFCSPHIGHO2_02_FULL_35_13]
MSNEEAELESTIMKGASIKIARRYNLSPEKSKEEYEKYAGHEEVEKEIASLIERTSLDSDISFNDSRPGRELQDMLEVGEVVNSIEVQIEKLKEHLKEIKNDPQKYLHMSKETEDQLKEVGIKLPGTFERNKGNKEKILNMIRKAKGK